MPKFVNYKKRAFTLPPGCKDLIDLLQQPKPKPLSLTPVHEPRLTRDESGTVQLRDISKYVDAVFDSRPNSADLVLRLPDERLTIHFGRMQSTLLGSVTVAHESELERLLREFFVAHALKLPDAEWTGWTPTPLVPGIPVWSIYSISPCPTTATDTLSLILEILRRVSRLGDDSPLTFHYLEMADAAS